MSFKQKTLYYMGTFPRAQDSIPQIESITYPDLGGENRRELQARRRVVVKPVRAIGLKQMASTVRPRLLGSQVSP